MSTKRVFLTNVEKRGTIIWFAIKHKSWKENLNCRKFSLIALELLGASFATSHFDYHNSDIVRAFEYIKRGREERFQDPSHPVLKQPMEHVEAYQNRKECQTLEELAQIEGDVDAIIMESLVITEGILGSVDNTKLTVHIRNLANNCYWQLRNFATCIQ